MRFDRKLKSFTYFLLAILPIIIYVLSCVVKHELQFMNFNNIFRAIGFEYADRVFLTPTTFLGSLFYDLFTMLNFGNVSFLSQYFQYLFNVKFIELAFKVVCIIPNACELMIKKLGGRDNE